MNSIKVTPKGDLNFVRNYGVIQMFKQERNLSYVIAGLEQIIGYDLEIALSLDISEVDRLIPEIIYHILEKKINLIDGLVTSELTGAPVLIQIRKPRTNLIKNKLVARVIFSDENFLLPNDEGCHKIYKTQID